MNYQAYRRMQFVRVVGETVSIKRDHLRGFPSREATLIKVNRTRAVVEFPDAPQKRIEDVFGRLVRIIPEQWDVPLEWLLLPGADEPDPRQRELPIMEGVQ